MNEPVLPGRLRDEVVRTLRPVRPLAPPWRRALWPGLVGLALLAAVPLVYSLRVDRAAVGDLLLWGGSVLQVGVGLLLVSRALAESIPGRLAGASHLAWHAGLAVAMLISLTLLTNAASPTLVPPSGTHYFEVCLSRSMALGLLPLAAVLGLLAAGLVVRPLTTGALAGLGAGLFADSSWRLYCEVSDPAHVLTAHLGAVVGVAMAGVLGGFLIARLRGQ